MINAYVHRYLTEQVYKDLMLAATNLTSAMRIMELLDTPPPQTLTTILTDIQTITTAWQEHSRPT